MISKNRPFTFFLFLIAVFVAVGIASAQEEPSIHGTKKADSIFQVSGLAIRGYDPVAYFTDGKPVKGKKEFERRHLGATWRFATAENKDAFLKNPDQYLPQYGGYCAYGMSRGYAAPIEADAWSIVDGKLYLNYNRDARKEWSKDIPGFIAKADQNWPKIPKKAVEE